MTLPAGTPIGKYVVRQKIAEGGMAEIYLATVKGPEGFEKEVVIKRIRPFLAGDPEFVKMFISEARVASKLNHANVVQIFDFDKHEDTYYLAMEYVRGKSLWDARRAIKELMVPFPATLVAHVASEVARGLHYAHQLTERGKPLSIVHRDVTPHNVLLSFDGAVKLTDFGIAKAGNKLTSPGMLKGKFAYMSPEQARGEDVDRRSDVFGLGIVVWEMLTGGKLFDGDSDVAVLRAVAERVIPPPSRLNPDVPEDLDPIVMKALDRDAAKRHQTAQELERALAQFVLDHRHELEDTDVGGFLRRLFGEALPEGGSADDLIENPRQPTAVMGRNPGSLPPAPPEDEDAVADTLVLERQRGEGAVPRHQRPTVPMGSVVEAIRQKEEERRREQEEPPEGTRSIRGGSAPTLPAPSIGMRRAAIAGAALFLVFAATAGVIALRASSHRHEAPVPAAPVEVAVTVAPSRPDAAVASPPPPPPVAAPVVPAAAVAPAPEASAPAPATGLLVVKVTPWARVLVDGQSKGEVSGTRSFRLPAGKHRLRFEHNRGTREMVVSIEVAKSAVEEFNALTLH